ncbi:MAG: VWA domain-containing protein [Chitinophagales bacterium]|nr:VWA domain-containing protein [Chitinophagales bacterium]
MHRSRILLIVFVPLVFVVKMYAQNQMHYKTRILLLLDASGSMKEKWGEATKFEAAKKILVHYIDSLEVVNPKTEFALRLFGAKYHRTNRNCTDSHIEVPFGPNNSRIINQRLSEVVPKGMTPIAYSLTECFKDFPDDASSTHLVVLITDGQENCDGNICKAAKFLAQKNIALRPYIIGINLSQKNIEVLSCVGEVMNASTSSQLSSAFQYIIQKHVNPTTVQINLLDKDKKPFPSNIAMSIADHSNHRILSNYIHTCNKKGQSDTLVLNPSKTYDVILHTSPPLIKENIAISANTHNIIGIEVAQGELVLKSKNTSSAAAELKYQDNLYLADVNSKKKLLAGVYEGLLTTIPLFKTNEIKVSPSQTEIFRVFCDAAINLFANSMTRVAVIDMRTMKRILQFEFNGNKTISLQPGEYSFIYIPSGIMNSDETKHKIIKAEEEKTYNLHLN